jgi:DNA-3-methyladenine glycosylase II
MKTKFKITKEQVNKLLQKEPKFSYCVTQFGIPQKTINPNVFESIIEAMIAQQISGKVAQVITNRLVEKVGVITPQSLLALSDEDYQKIGLGAQKRGYIRSISKSFLSGELKEDHLKTLKEQELIKELIKLKGVGEWTAQMLLIFSLGHSNILSYKDLGIKKGLMKLYGKNNIDDITPEFFNECKQTFSPYNTLASFYLWELASQKEPPK